MSRQSLFHSGTPESIN